MSLVRILARCSKEKFEPGLEEIIRGICQSLTSKDVVARDRAREALVEVNLIPDKYLYITCESLIKCLEKGF